MDIEVCLVPHSTDMTSERYDGSGVVRVIGLLCCFFKVVKTWRMDTLQVCHVGRVEASILIRHCLGLYWLFDAEEQPVYDRCQLLYRFSWRCVIVDT